MGRAGAKLQTFHGHRRLFRRFARKTFGSTDLEQIKGVLPHAGLPVFFTTKNATDHKGHKDCQNGKPPIPQIGAD